MTENVKTMYRKTLKEATQQEIYQAVSLAVKDVVMDEWMATQQVIEKMTLRYCIICPWSF